MNIFSYFRSASSNNPNPIPPNLIQKTEPSAKDLLDTKLHIFACIVFDNLEHVVKMPLVEISKDLQIKVEHVVRFKFEEFEAAVRIDTRKDSYAKIYFFKILKEGVDFKQNREKILSLADQNIFKCIVSNASKDQTLDKVNLIAAKRCRVNLKNTEKNLVEKGVASLLTLTAESEDSMNNNFHSVRKNPVSNPPLCLEIYSNNKQEAPIVDFINQQLLNNMQLRKTLKESAAEIETTVETIVYDQRINLSNEFFNAVFDSELNKFKVAFKTHSSIENLSKLSELLNYRYNKRVSKGELVVRPDCSFYQTNTNYSVFNAGMISLNNSTAELTELFQATSKIRDRGYFW